MGSTLTESYKQMLTCPIPAAAAPQARVYRQLKLWLLLADLEESLGTLEGVSGVYDRMLELKIATPQTILNHALYLQEHKHWEDAFRVGGASKEGVGGREGYGRTCEKCFFGRGGGVDPTGW